MQNGEAGRQRGTGGRNGEFWPSIRIRPRPSVRVVLSAITFSEFRILATFFFLAVSPKCRTIYVEGIQLYKWKEQQHGQAGCLADCAWLLLCFSKIFRLEFLTVSGVESCIVTMYYCRNRLFLKQGGNWLMNCINGLMAVNSVNGSDIQLVSHYLPGFDYPKPLFTDRLALKK